MPQLVGIGSEKLATADGSYCEIEGTVTLGVSLAGEIYQAEFTVANITDHMILGMPTLMSMGCVLDFGRKQLLCQGVSVQCFDFRRTPIVGQVVVHQAVTVPPRCEYLIKGCINRVKDFQEGCFHFEPSEKLLEKYGVVLARALVKPRAGTFVVRVCNPNEEGIMLYTGMALGCLSKVEVIGDYESVGRVARTVVPKVEGELPDHLKDLYERTVDLVPESDRPLVREMLCKFQDVFSRDDKDLGRTSLVQHHIETGDAKPIKQAPRRLPPQHRNDLEKQVLDLLDRGLIEPSDSAWASPVVMVKKSDGSLRLCIDMRRLNEVSSGSGIPLPNTSELLASLSGAVWFSTLDMLSGYWQVELDEESRPKTAFATHLGLHQWRVMPFGLSGAPGSFQKLMHLVLGSMSYKQLLVYLDDVIVPARTVHEGMERLSEVFGRFRSANLKLKPKKCTLFQRQAVFLGHVVSADGVATDPSKVETVANWPTPSSKSEVRSFLGLASYYRKYIQGFAHVAYPLNRLTDKRAEFQWNEACQAAFDKLKVLLTQAPILAHPNEEGEFLLDTDASGVGIGAVLSQIQGGQEKVVAYSSKALSAAERNYCVTRKELWAVVYHVRHFRCYLYGRHFTIRTDHGSLRWLHRFKNQRVSWLDVLAKYEYAIICRYALSRQPCTGKGCMCAPVERKAVSVYTQTGDCTGRACVLRGTMAAEDIESSVVKYTHACVTQC